MTVLRSPFNPIIQPKDVKPSRPDFEVIGVFNAGVARYQDEVILLLRIAERPLSHNPLVFLSPMYDPDSRTLTIKEISKDNPAYDFSDLRVVKSLQGTYLTSISHLRVARSKDGIHFEIQDQPALFPANEYEIYGIEDPRISLIGDTYYINYSAISNIGITTCLASTRDFNSFQRLGVILAPDNKDVEIFPAKIHGKYYALHRPSISNFGNPDIWIAESPDLLCWGNHRYLMGTREGYWDNGRIGGSAVPFLIDQGWLEIYHGATKDDRYCLGAVLLDKDHPWKVIARCEKPVMEPEANYEVNGFFGKVVFSCGVLYEEKRVKVYYGAADTVTAYAEIPLDDILRSLI